MRKSLKKKKYFLFLNIIVQLHILFLHFRKEKKIQIICKRPQNRPNNFSQDEFETFLDFDFIYTLFCMMTNCKKSKLSPPERKKKSLPPPPDAISTRCD